MRTGALLALALVAFPAMTSATVVTITGKIGSYEIDHVSTYLDDDGNYQTYTTTEKHFHGGDAGAKYTITFDGDLATQDAEGFNITSPEPLFQFSGSADWDGTRTFGSTLDAGSGGFEGDYINVITSGLGTFTHRQGYYDSSGVGNETDLVLNLFPIGSAVPEPASWVTMLLGLAGIGGAMRRRVRAPA